MLSRAEIESQNEYLLKSQRDFRLAAEFVATAMSENSRVEKIVLFGSVANPLVKEIPRFREYRREGIAVWHECRDVDVAVWVDSLEDLKSLRRAKIEGLKTVARVKNITTADHQVDVFVMEPKTDRYLGRLCVYGECPKAKKVDCMASGCGDRPFLKQMPDFRFDPRCLDGDVSVVLFQR